MKKKRALAAMLAIAVAATGLPPSEISAAQLTQDAGVEAKIGTSTPVLNLKFEDNLTDASSSQNQVSPGDGKSVSYETGVNGQGKALTLDGKTFLNLGKNTVLSPENLTLSFWLKPNGKMSGEQIITWNKTKYYTDGWYLTSESDKAPLALSVGPAKTDGQPYKISVNGDRSTFFPAGQWTHIAVTYNSQCQLVKLKA